MFESVYFRKTDLPSTALRNTQYYPVGDPLIEKSLITMYSVILRCREESRKSYWAPIILKSTGLKVTANKEDRQDMILILEDVYSA